MTQIVESVGIEPLENPMENVIWDGDRQRCYCTPAEYNGSWPNRPFDVTGFFEDTALGARAQDALAKVIAEHPPFVGLSQIGELKLQVHLPFSAPDHIGSTGTVFEVSLLDVAKWHQGGFDWSDGDFSLMREDANRFRRLADQIDELAAKAEAGEVDFG